MNPANLKDRLPHTWEALFGRFGRFTEIQTQAIEPLLDGKNCMLVSATASGKTEAALAPLIERFKQAPRQEQSGLALVYIVPTRALARDLARRLKQALEQLSMRMQVKTGDDPGLDSARLPKLLITTPESFDSLLAGHARATKDVRGVILDEIHLLDNTPRGDQLRILLNRLRRIKRYAHERGDTSSGSIQFCALSATIDDPAAVASRYFTDPVVVRIAARRAIDAESIRMNGTESLAALFAGLQRRGRRKLLVFCMQRAECEHLANTFRAGSPFGDRVFVHHASLDAGVRREVEKSFAMADAAVCFATSTLELGVDIGDVDLIVLVGPPGNTSGFLQRIGRGNRRTARTAVTCFYRDEMERALFQIFIRMSSAGEIEPDPYVFRPSVITQQLFSYIKQTRLGEIVPDAAYALFASPNGEPLISKDRYDLIVERLTAKEYFVAQGNGALRPGRQWKELYEKRAIYSNLAETRQAVDVVDEMTGRKLGEVGWGIRPGVTFYFSGRSLRATHLHKRRLLVRSSAVEVDRQVPRLGTPRRPLSPALARAVAVEMGLPGANSPAYMTMARVMDETETATEEAWLFHCAGEAYGRILGDLIESEYNVRVQDSSGLYLVLEGVPAVETLQFSSEQVGKRLVRRWRQFESGYDLGGFQSLLPLEVRRQTVIDAFRIAEFLHTFSGRTILQ